MSAVAGARPGLVAWLVTFAASMAVAGLQGPRLFYYDSQTYWWAGESFIRGGGFSLLAFDSGLRGYLIPLVNLGLREIADGLAWNHATLAKVSNAAVFALLAGVLLPMLAETAWPRQRWGVGRRLLLAALLLLMWRGFLDYPLSDFPAVAAVVLAVVAVARSERPGWMAVTGFAAAAAINMRPAYVLLIPVLAALVAFSWWERRGDGGHGRRALGVGLLLAGFVAVSLPQTLMHHRHHDTWSFVPGSPARLTRLQFTEGMRMQRYETYVGREVGPRLSFLDETGGRLLQEQQNGTVESAGQYLELVVRHPLEMAGLFARHVINGLDQRYPTPYIESLDDGGNRWMRVLGFLLVFSALARVLWPTSRRALGTARWRYPAALLLCSASAVASAVEARFLLPVAVLSYVVVLAPGWPPPAALVRGRTLPRRALVPAALAASLAAFFAVVLHVIGSATDHLVLIGV